MRFEEGIKQLDYVGENTPISLRKQFTDKEGNCDEIALELECYRVWAAEVFRVLKKLQETYAPKIKMTKIEYEMIKSFKRLLQIGVGIVDYSGQEPKVLFSNEFNFFDAWLNPELIEVEDD